MAKITDPDNLQLKLNGTATTEEVEIQTGAKTIKLTLAGGLDDAPPGKTSGVTAKALYSFLKEEWLGGAISQNDVSATLRRFKFPLKMIFEGSFIWVNGWKPLNDQTRDLIRDAGFQEVSTDEYSCLVSLGSIDAPASDQVYYTNVAGFTQTTNNYDKTGELNENIQIKGGTGTDNYVKSFLREEAKLYAEYSLLAEQGLSILGFQAYSFPLSNGPDLKITVPATTYYDINIDSGSTGIADGVYGDNTYPTTAVAGARMRVDYLKGTDFTTYADTTAYIIGDVVFDPNVQANGSSNGTWWISGTAGTSSGTNTGNDVAITWTAYFGGEQIGGEWYAFNRIIDCNGLTDRQAYAWAQFMLRQSTDINADCTNITAGQGGFGSVNGNVAALLVEYVGETLKPLGGVLLRNFDTNSTNSIIHSAITVDQTDATTGAIGLDSESVPLGTNEVSFPFVAAGNFNFSNNLDAETADSDSFYTVYFQYITTTTDSNIVLTTAGGAITGTIDYSAASAGAQTTLNGLATGDYLDVQGFSGTTTNNGLYVLTGNPTANTIAVTKEDGVNLVAEIVGASVTLLKNPFESPGAVIVNDDSGPAPLSGDITSTSIIWDFDYTANTQDGRTSNSDAPIIIVAQSLNTAEWISATHTITKATGQNIAINSGDERNYSND